MTVVAGPRGSHGYGVDGCRGGWFFFHVTGRDFEFGLSERIDGLPGVAPGRAPILIDMPIGLTSGDPPVRACDVLARRLLGVRAASVFPPPCRPALAYDEYDQASIVNQRHTGRKLSRQTWGLMPKIRELDELLSARPAARSRFRECHPELCFFGLADGAPMRHYKKTAQGFQEREALLRDLWPPARAAIEAACQSYPATRVARDDIVDALALALAAALGPRRLATLPDAPEKDAAGQPMRIVFPRPSGGWPRTLAAARRNPRDRRPSKP